MAQRRLQVTFTQEQYDALKRLAELRRQPMAEVIRDAIRLEIVPRWERIKEERARQERDA